MKKYIVTLMLAIAGSCAAWAEDMVACVIVELNSAENMALALGEKPKVQFDGDDVVITTANFEGAYKRADIVRFYFDEVPTGIKTMEADANRAHGEVYDMGGRKVASYDGTLDTTTLPAGVYVVKTAGGTTCKVTKK